MDIGHKIYRLRKTNNLTQEEFAALFHVSRQTVSNWENNRTYPDMDTLKMISDKFDVSFDTLLKEDTELIRKIDNTKKNAKKMTWIIATVILLIVVLAVWKTMPGIVSKCYYDPGRTIASTADDASFDDSYSIDVSQMTMDISVFSELFVPCRKYDAVESESLGYGRYNVVIGQSFRPANTEAKNIAGQITRNKLLLYDPDALQSPPGNAFEWTVNTRDAGKTLEENITDENPAMAMSGDRDEATENLKTLNENQTYIGYVSFNEVMDYEDASKLLKPYDVSLSWMGIVTSKEPHQDIIGLHNSFSGVVYPFDSERYPHLLGVEEDRFAKEHFISMLKYMSEQKTFLKMIGAEKYMGYSMEDSYFADKIGYVEENGLKVYGVAVAADKGALLELNENENVYSIATEIY